MPATLRGGGSCLFAVALASLQAEERTLGSKDLLSELLQRDAEIQAGLARVEATTNPPCKLRIELVRHA